MSFEPRKTVRIIALDATKKGVLKTVNIVTARATKDIASIKACLQAAGAPRKNDPEYPTFMDSGGSIAGLPTIFIAGYVGPA